MMPACANGALIQRQATERSIHLDEEVAASSSGGMHSSPSELRASPKASAPNEEEKLQEPGKNEMVVD
jgi:hypothetical protein